MRPVNRISGLRITDYGSQAHAYHVILAMPVKETWSLQWSCFIPSLVPPLHCAGGGTEEPGDTAIQSVAERNAIIGS